MNSFTASVPKHPLLQEKNTELLSLRIGPVLQKKLTESAEKNQNVFNEEVRNALAHYVQPLSSRMVVNTPVEQPQVVPIDPQLSDDEKTYFAFSNATVIKAIQSVAQSIENASIECTADAIIEHFVSFCPIIKA